MADRLSSKGDRLIEQAEGVPQAPFTGAGQREEAAVLDRQPLFLSDVTKPLDELGPRDAAKIVVLATRENRRGNFVNLRRREDEDDVSGRLFKRFEQSVERRVGEHVHFIDDIDPIPTAEGHEFDVLSNLPHVVHAGVGRPVNLHDVGGTSLGDLETIRAAIARVACGAMLAVQGLRQNASDGGFSDASSPGKQVCVGDTLGRDRVQERLNDVWLADHISKRAGAVFTGGDLVIHKNRQS